MAKRSPISGYNHNVRYRGLIFHVQTEDSGVMSPHLFTHLFYEGVIISTRKLVYDAGSDEGAIKSLMQAQHKAVLKDLKRNTFDDKIDVYLAGTPGLLPRGAIDPGDEVGAAAAAADNAAAAASRDSASAITASASGEIMPPLPLEDDSPTLTGGDAAEIAAMVAGAAAPAKSGSKPQIEIVPQLDLDDGLGDLDLELPRKRQPRDTDVEMPFDASVDVGAGGRGQAAPVAILDVGPTLPNMVPTPAGAASAAAQLSSAALPLPPVPSSPAIALPTPGAPGLSDGVPPMVPTTPGGNTSRTATGPTAGQAPERRTLDRIPAVNASALPPIPTRASTRPPTAATSGGARAAMPAPVVVSRPLTDDNRPRTESDAAEIFSPAPPSVEAPPGSISERPGQYSQHRRSRQISVMPDPRSGPTAIPAGLGRPPRPPMPPRARPPTPEKTDPATLRTSVPPPSGGMRAVTPPAGVKSDSGSTRTGAPSESAPNRVPTGQQPPLARPDSAGARIPTAPQPPLSRADSAGTRTPTAPQPPLSRADSAGTRVPTASQPPLSRPDSAGTRVPTASQPPLSRPESLPPPTPPLARTATGSNLRSDPTRPRTPTPARIQPGAPTRPHVTGTSGGVVMTRPAVIVGAPAKTTGQTKVRKAREDEGRGFGQGLISEKSLDEVILAYLSEDGDEK